MKKNKRIIIADDSERNLRLLKAILKAEGYIVETAHNGRDALDKVRKLGPDLIILDMRMPEMDGIEACRAIRGDTATRNIPVVFLSAFSDPESRAHAEEAGSDEFITKPIDITDFIKCIQGLIENNQSC